MKELKENLKKTMVLISKSTKSKGWYGDQDYEEWIHYDLETRKQYKKTRQMLKDMNFKDKKIKDAIAKLPYCLINYSIPILWLCAIGILITYFLSGYLQTIFPDIQELFIPLTFLAVFLLVVSGFRIMIRSDNRRRHIFSTLYDIEELLRNHSQRPQAFKKHSKNILKSRNWFF